MTRQFIDRRLPQGKIVESELKTEDGTLRHEENITET